MKQLWNKYLSNISHDKHKLFNFCICLKMMDIILIHTLNFLLEYVVENTLWSIFQLNWFDLKAFKIVITNVKF